jgi:hypothetical protein
MFKLPKPFGTHIIKPCAVDAKHEATDLMLLCWFWVLLWSSHSLLFFYSSLLGWECQLCDIISLQYVSLLLSLQRFTSMSLS